MRARKTSRRDGQMAQSVSAGVHRDLMVKLQREQAAHKITKDETQKARNALAFVRTQAQVSPHGRSDRSSPVLTNTHGV